MALKEREIKQVSWKEHVLDLGKSMWAGDKSLQSISSWVFSIDDNRITQQDRMVSPLLMKIIDEIVVNATDQHTIYSREVKNINVKFADGFVEVYNDGVGIAVLETKTVDGRPMYTPQLIYTEFLSGSNLVEDKDRIVGGQNGIGAKLTSIYSKEFHVETVDAVRKLKYTQTMLDNISIIQPPTVITYTGPAYTKIRFLPDYDRIGIDIAAYDSVLRELIEFRAIQITASCSVIVRFNDTQLNPRGFRGFCDMMLGTYQPATVRISKIKDRTENCKNWDLAVGLSDSKFQQFTIVNGVHPEYGGSHVLYISKLLTEFLTERVTAELGSEAKTTKITKANLLNPLFIVARCTIPDVTYKGQSKDAVSNPIGDYDGEISKADQSLIWYHVKDAIMEGISKKQTTVETKRIARGRLERYKYIEAEYCTTKLRSQCTLILVEGDSANTTAFKGLRKSDSDYFNFNYFGTYSLGGVIVNGLKESKKERIRKADNTLEYKMSKLYRPGSKTELNERISTLKEVLGLRYGVTYESDEEFETLRYGRVACLTDQDLDGFNICGLVCTYFLTYWPALVRRGFVCRIYTPLLRLYPKRTSRSSKLDNDTNNADNDADNSIDTSVDSVDQSDKKSKVGKRGKKSKASNEVLEFYSEADYRKWLGSLDDPTSVDRKYEICYYKGLATHEEVNGEIYSMFSNINSKMCTFELDEQAIYNMHVYYGDTPDLRKVSLATPVEEHPTFTRVRPLTYQFTVDTKEFQRNNIIRKLPNCVDGLMNSRRKVLFGAWLARNAGDKKIDNLAGYIIDKTNYHHGSSSMESTIITMSQYGNSAMNLPLITCFSANGSYEWGYGDSGAPRYLKGKVNARLVGKLFRPEDIELLEYEVEDGTRYEPRYYVPIIPYSLAESYSLPATGWKVTTYARDVFALINRVRAKIKGEGDFRDMPISMLNLDCKYEVTNSGEYFVGEYKYRSSARTILIQSIPRGVFPNKYLGIEEVKKIDPKAKGAARSKGAASAKGKPTTRGKPAARAKGKPAAKSKPGAKGKRSARKPTDADDADQDNDRDDDRDADQDNDRDADQDDEHGVVEDNSKRFSIRGLPYIERLSHANIKNGICEILLAEGGREYIEANYGSDEFDAFIDYFKLKFKINHLINMVDADGKVIEFQDYADVAEYWYAVRKDLYAKRVDRELLIYNAQLEQLQNMQRFNRSHASYGITPKTKLADAEQLLASQRPPYTKLNVSLLHTASYMDTADLKVAIYDGTYDYLLDMGYRSLTNEEYKKREAKIADIESKLKLLMRDKYFKGAELWLEELDELEQVIQEGIRTSWTFSAINSYVFKQVNQQDDQ